MAEIIEAQKGLAARGAEGIERARLGARHVRHEAAEEDHARQACRGGGGRRWSRPSARARICRQPLPPEVALSDPSQPVISLRP